MYQNYIGFNMKPKCLLKAHLQEKNDMLAN